MRPSLSLASALLACCVAARAQVPDSLVLPPRATQAKSGSQLRAELSGLSLTTRETRLWHEIAAGNVPPFLRQLVPVTTQAVIGGVPHSATFWCARDVFGLGGDQDWFRMPMTPTLAQQVCDRLECVLPTRRMSDLIWAAAPVKLAPFPYNPAAYDILSLDLFHSHHLQIESQRGNQSQSLLVAGHKKDVVASALIGSWPGRVVIYGWHYQNGTAIQPLSKVHTFAHVDYSHGIRLVARRCEVDGRATTIDAVLADPQLSVLLSDESAFTSWRYPLGTDESFPLHDTFPGAPQLAGWRAKFTAPVAVTTVPPPPSGDGTALRVMDPAGGTESLRIGAVTAVDVGVQADLLCEYRPQLAADGFERVGVFVRDQAAGAFDGTLSQQGACYALTWDGHDGRVQLLRCQGGVRTDLLSAPVYRTGTAWRRLRLEVQGSALRAFVDGVLVGSAVDTTFATGECGVGFHEYFVTNANMRGARVDTFTADVPGAFALRFDRGPSPGDLTVRRQRGIPGDLAFTAVTIVPGAFPNGWFFGLDPQLPDVLAQWGAGHPAFVGLLGPDGGSTFTVPAVPPGVPLQAVALDLDPTLRWWQPSAPVSLVTR
ncbi:MAG: hypothetical protein KDC48_09975 [Planctomycetes bacterium]|nr:hypothetical protein [Planctomycetota bacterium]